MAYTPRPDKVEYIRAYLKNGSVGHLLPDFADPSWPEPALCGITPGFGGAWHGTGSQDEYDTAAAKAICLNCERRRRRPQ